jgi:serine phosphatase RsbU (regulator of sigma subunit)
MTATTSTKPDPEFFGTLKEDLRRGDFQQTIRRDFGELREYMLEEERRKRLAEMRPLKRWLVLIWWLLKSMFFRLTPARRIILLGGLFLVFLARTSITLDGDSQLTIQTNGIGVLAILFVLMLELKDKLVAHDELKAGRAVQQALMPERNPSVLGWDLWLFTRSANEVGGDLVDFLKLDGQRYGIAIGDVAGKGLSAALLTAKLQATLRALAGDFTSLAELAAKVNQIFCRDSLRSIFASMAYVELRPDSGSLRLVNAGHIPPILLRRTGIEKLVKGGVALGIMPTASFDEQRLDLDQGEVIVIYSDGLTEAQNTAGDLFGEQRLAGLLPLLHEHSAERIGERLVAEVDSFVGEGRAFDDLSLVVLKRTG